MSTNFRQIAAICLAATCSVGCDRIPLLEDSDISIEQVSPDVFRSDKPTTLTITGTGFDETSEVRFGFKRRGSEIDMVKPTNLINGNTLEVVTPVLPGIDEKARVFVRVVQPKELADESDETPTLTELAQDLLATGSTHHVSNLVELTVRPPNIIDLYGFYALGVIGGVAAISIALALVRRGFRRIAFRNAVLEAKGKRLMLRDERRAKAVLAEIAAEKEAEQAKLEAEYLPYADQASGADADE